MTRSIWMAAAGCAALYLGSPAAFAEDGCKSFSGAFTAVAPAVCPSAVNICTHGTLTGGFPSIYDFVMDTLVPTGRPGEFTYTGHSVITTKHGAQLFGSDSGVLQSLGAVGAFVTTVQVYGGTRKYLGATGTIVAPGVLEFATGATTGTYSGTICKAEAEDENDDD
jgi:hypothetical protein